jgi:hypothetical protein
MKSRNQQVAYLLKSALRLYEPTMVTKEKALFSSGTIRKFSFISQWYKDLKTSFESLQKKTDRATEALENMRSSLVGANNSDNGVKKILDEQSRDGGHTTGALKGLTEVVAGVPGGAQGTSGALTSLTSEADKASKALGDDGLSAKVGVTKGALEDLRVVVAGKPGDPASGTSAALTSLTTEADKASKALAAITNPKTDDVIEKVLKRLEGLRCEIADDVIKKLIGLLSGICIAGGAAYVGSDEIPEELQEFLEKSVPAMPRRQRIYIEPELFDTTKNIERVGTKRLEQEIALRTTQKSPQRIFALVGEAGSGKSEMALEYAGMQYGKFKSANPDRTRIAQVLHAEDEDILENEYRVFAEKLGINTAGKKVDDICLEISSKLNCYKNWIIILDNVEDYRVVEKYIPKTVTGAVLITSRSHCGLTEAEVEPFNINDRKFAFTDSEAVSLFKKVYGVRSFIPSDEIKISSLSGELFASPLAISRAAELGFSRIGSRVTKFQDMFVNPTTRSINDLLQLTASNKSKMKDHNSAVLELNKLLIGQLSVEQKCLLTLLSFLNPDYSDTIPAIKVEIYDDRKKQYVNKDIGKIVGDHILPLWRQPLSNVEDIKWIKVLKELQMKGFVTGYRGDRAHRSLREAIASVSSGEEIKAAIAAQEVAILQALSPIFASLRMSNYLPDEKARNAAIVPHVLSFVRSVQKIGFADVDLNVRAIAALRNMSTSIIASDPFRAKKYLLQAKKMYEELFDLDFACVFTPEYLLTRIAQRETDNQKQREILDLYAGILYQLGRCHIYIRDPDDSSISKEYFEYAKQIAQRSLGLAGTTALVYNTRKHREQTSIYDENNQSFFEEGSISVMLEDDLMHAVSDEERITKVKDAIDKWKPLIDKESKRSKALDKIESIKQSLVAATKLEDLVSATNMINDFIGSFEFQKPAKLSVTDKTMEQLMKACKLALSNQQYTDPSYRTLVTGYSQQIRFHIKLAKLEKAKRKDHIKNAMDLLKEIAVFFEDKDLRQIVCELRGNPEKSTSLDETEFKSEKSSLRTSVYKDNLHPKLGSDMDKKTLGIRENLRIPEFYNFLGQILLLEERFADAEYIFNLIVRDVEKSCKLDDSNIPAVCIGRIEAALGEDETRDDRDVYEANRSKISFVEKELRASEKVQRLLRRTLTHPEMQEVSSWRSKVILARAVNEVSQVEPFSETRL